MTSEDRFEILIGTYEEFILGYQLIKGENKEYSLTQTFVTHSHQASVRSIAATSKLFASSGADETVVLYDMVKRKQSGALNQQEGTITCLKFTPDGCHLVSCSDDGSIALFRVGSWQLEKLFKKAHKGTAVNHITIHPSGKLALSVGKDKTLRTWNLIKGRPAYTTNLSSFGVAYENLDFVIWSPNGLLYAIPIQRKAVIFSVEKAGIVHTLNSTSKIHSVCFLNESTICLGNEESLITAFDLNDESELWNITVSKARVKSLVTYNGHLIAITSAGDLKVWRYEIDDVTSEPVKLAENNDGCRFTCLTVRPPIQSDKVESNSNPKKKKKKSKPSESSSEILSQEKKETQNKEKEDEIEVINISIGDTKRKDKYKSPIKTPDVVDEYVDMTTPKKRRIEKSLDGKKKKKKRKNVQNKG